MDIPRTNTTVVDEKLVQSTGNERVSNTYPVAIDSNDAHDTPLIPVSTESNLLAQHYISEPIPSENSSEVVESVETKPVEVQEYYSFEEQKTSDQYVVEELEEKVVTNEFVEENQTGGVLLVEEEGNVVHEEVPTEDVIIQENEPSTEQYIDSTGNSESDIQDSSVNVEDGETCTINKEHVEFIKEKGNPTTVNENIEFEHIDTVEGEIEPAENIGNEDKIEYEHADSSVEEIIIEEDVHDMSEEASSINESIDVQTSEAEESLAEGQDDVEMTSRQIVQGEDGTILTVETYRTDASRDSKKSSKTVVEVAPPKQRKTRKPPFDVPMHVLGVDISKPNESVPNGRPAPKPRLGVKVPYRNLTSQIVSKAEIEEEIMERSRQKQEQQKVNIQFARSLTQRLAKKIAPPKETVSATVENTLEEEVEDDPLQTNECNQVVTSTESNTIENDSDLLAILEGDGEDMPVLPKVVTTQEDDSNLKALEREIALQQLQELPSQEPKPRIFKSRKFKSQAVSPEVSAKTKSTVLEATPQKLNPEKPSDKNKENSSKQSTSKSQSGSPEKKDPYNIDLSVSPKKVPIEVEPQVKVNMVLKTYSRKRKFSDVRDPLENTPLPKKPSYEDPDVKLDIDVPSPSSEVYITKSSRVIKKKVIWDPADTAEAQPRTPKPTPKTVEAKSPINKIMKSEKASNQEKSEKKMEKPVVKKDKISPEKKIVKESPKSIKSPPKPKKPRSEIDKLLMDEGAVKMLYELNNDEPLAKKKKDFYSVDRAEREILKKANQLKNELQQNSDIGNQKSLRKKESFTPSPMKPVVITLERKMSKDSTLSSVQNTPPGSPFPHSQGSMLIRRRSSSSLSSSDNNFDLDEPLSKVAKRRADGSRPKKAKKSTEVPKLEIKNKTENIESPVKASKAPQFKSFSIKRIGKTVSIDLNYIDESCYFTSQVLEELTTVLKRFAKDKECFVVTLTSDSKAFCLGLDYSSLINEDEDIRKEEAKYITDRVRDFLTCLLHFPKILIASVQGECVGLGVTMLPLFDMVIASDKATFSTPYSKLGCGSEAGFLLSFPNFTNHGLASELLYTGQKLTADDAFRRGLVTRLCWPEKYKDTLKNIVMSISQGSKQSLESMKKQLRSHSIKQAEVAINTDMKMLIDHWTSAECQKKFSELENVV